MKRSSGTAPHLKKKKSQPNVKKSRDRRQRPGVMDNELIREKLENKALSPAPGAAASTEGDTRSG